MTREPHKPGLPEFRNLEPNASEAERGKYDLEIVEVQGGKKVTVMRFPTFKALEAFFLKNCIGTAGEGRSELMKNSSSKVIGTTLMIWDRH